MGNVISLASYKRLSVKGTTLTYRGLRLRLTAPQAFVLAEDLRGLTERPGQVARPGSVIRFDGERFTLTVLDLGPVELTKPEAKSLALELAKAVHPVARSIAP